MNIQIKLYELINAFNIISKYSETEPNDVPVTARVSFKVAKFLRCALEDIDLYNKSMAKILDKYKDKFELDEKGEIKVFEDGSSRADKDTVKSVNEERANLLNTLTNCSVMFKVSELSAVYPISISEWALLMPIVEDDTDEE